MATKTSSDTERTGEPLEVQSDIDEGNYELIRSRLLHHGEELDRKIADLNERRQSIFGNIELTIIGNERVRTEHNCVPRDIVSVGDKLLFGYNVFMGLKKQTAVQDVFSLHHFIQTDEGFDLSAVPTTHPSLLTDPAFIRDFEDLYRYYKETRLMHLRRTESRLLAIFQTSPDARDVKVFRWAIEPGGVIQYIDNRGESDYVFPAPFDFEWIETTREDHVKGRHPHVSILDTIFVETIGGDLTIKVENNTEAGEGIYSEPVEDKYQSLDDAEIAYARLGALIVLKVKPYRELETRYLVYNTRTQSVKRIDAIGQSCQQLPGGHGIIFPGGYYLNTGETRTFDADVSKTLFKNSIRSPNGEDVLYVFYEPDEGRKVLLPYNVIRKEVATPILCHGFSLFDDGRMVVFRADENEPTRVHPMQIWQTPFQSAEYVANAPKDTSFLGTIGNAELVRGISDAITVSRSIANQKPTTQSYEDLIAAVNRCIDTYHWLGHRDVGNLLETLKSILSTAEKVIDEFEKVVAIKKRTEAALKESEEVQKKLRRSTRPESFSTVDAFVEALAQWRKQLGTLYALRELRYLDKKRLENLEKEASEQLAHLTDATARFLMDENALKPHLEEIEAVDKLVDDIQESKVLAPHREEIERIGTGFDLLTDVISGLKIEDADIRTTILERISEVYAHLNRTRAHIEAAWRTLVEREGIERFGVEFKLFAQAVSNALNSADSPERCDEQLSRLMVQLEDLEARYGEFDQFLADLAAKREEVFEAFESKKQTLLEARQRRAQNMVKAAERILAGISRRAQAFKNLEDLHAYFISDPMIAKVRDIAEDLRNMGEGMRADDLETRLKTARQEAARASHDRAELFEEGENIIRLGRHRFTVNTQKIELTLMPRDDEMTLHLTGTHFFERIDNDDLEAARAYWNQELVSENDEVYRGEYLAASMFFDAEEGRNGLSLNHLRELAENAEGLLAKVREYAALRYDEGYERGVHDADAAAILRKLLHMAATADLLRHAPRARAFGQIFWAFAQNDTLTKRLHRKALSFGRLLDAFERSPALEDFADEVGTLAAHALRDRGLDIPPELEHRIGAYLADELRREHPRFVLSQDADRLLTAFKDKLFQLNIRERFLEDLNQEPLRLADRHALAQAWLGAFIDQADEDIRDLLPARDEAVASLLTEGRLDRDVSSALVSTEIEGLLGVHPRISQRRMHLRLDEFLTRLGDFRAKHVPGFQAFRRLRHDILEGERERLRLDEFEPKVLTSFVRNQLINDVYLPIIGENLAKQMGAVGAGRRTDLMGLLLLISPPGYGKTTLMEYVANRLGLIFMKINGPALGHGVTSLDPQEAPNITARQEIIKLNLALEMGNNVMLYIDDIQHTNPEFLQKFISLCDAQRRIEGVWKGQTRTYDLRGRRFCIVMAGNPYTESGQKFQIPDMLSNRADTYNLGDILEGRDEAFALSYLENALTSNPVLSPLASRDPKDVLKIIRMAKGEEIPTSELSHEYSRSELDDIISVFQKLFVVQRVLLMVNQQYIQSASQADEYRTEPPFKLQGSYRNMNKIAARIVPIMNEEELESLIDDHYVGEAQTLTVGAEQNLLKLAELRGKLTEEEAERWEEIKKSFNRLQLMSGTEDDPVARLMAPLSALVQEVRDVRASIDDPVRRELVESIDKLSEQVLDARAGVNQAVKNEVGAPLTSLGKALEASRTAFGASIQNDVAQPLRDLVTLLSSSDERLPERLREAIASPLEALTHILEDSAGTKGRDRANLIQAMSSGLETVAGAIDASSKSLESSALPLLRHDLRALASTMAASSEALRETLPSSFAEPVHRLGDRIEQSSRMTAQALGHAAGQPLESLTEGVKEGQKAITQALLRESHMEGLKAKALQESFEHRLETLTRELGEHLRRLVESTREGVALRREKEADQRAAASVTQALDTLNTTIAHEASATGNNLAKAFAALVQQVDAIRRGLQQTLGPGLDESLDALSQKLGQKLEHNLEAHAAAHHRTHSGASDALQARLERVAEELEEIRYTLHAAIHTTMPELSENLDRLRHEAALEESLGGHVRTGGKAGGRSPTKRPPPKPAPSKRDEPD